jgi:hypothetical protein
MTEDFMKLNSNTRNMLILIDMVITNLSDAAVSIMDNPEQVKSFLTYLVQVNETIIKYKNKEIQGEEEQGKEDLDANRIQ